MRTSRRLLLPAATGAALSIESAVEARDRGISAISLERLPCFGLCPEDLLVIRADGSAGYEGRRAVPLLGSYVGRLEPRDFRRIARLVQEIHFFRLKDRYDAPVSDLPSRVTRVVGGGTRKSVENYGDYGPAALWILETALLGGAFTISWEPEA